MQEALDFGIVLALAYQTFVDELHAELAAHGITDLRPSYGYVLRTLAEAPLNQRALAHRLGVTDQAIAKLVAEMARRKLVARAPDPDDARARLLVVGPRGKDVLRIAHAFHGKFERRLERALGDDVATTRRVLEHVIGTGAPAATRLRLV
ncbi:MAG TPA: MarR family transcriptional regulator [Kofleriaceae bacterium]|nr:MarR family transcriptional regulator [Kofleriaceae bacterium]